MDGPRLVGHGPPTFSTSVELVKPYQIVWDTNGYYRDLGVRTDASRAELRSAYQKKRGWRSTRLTYVLRQLLDTETRRGYDSTPLGSLYFDAYVEEMLRRQRMAEVVRLRSEGQFMLADLLREMPVVDDPTVDDFLPTEFSRRHPPPPPAWPWAYYVWKCYGGDTRMLAEWQHLLIEELGHRRYQIAVGFVGHSPWEVAVVGYRVVAFIGDTETPTAALAKRAAQAIEKQMVNY